MKHQESLTLYLAAFVAELVQSGVNDVVISPGSRSTPLAYIMAEHPDLRVHIQVDERSAAFFALGIAKASRKSVALLCTSGTAAANYYPAIVEANISRVPLIVLTADRPHELRDVGAPQAIDQIHLYGKHVKWFVEMALPEGTDELVRYAQTVCARAIATSTMTPAGPVHLNFPIREPLLPLIDDPELFTRHERIKGAISIQPGELSLSRTEFQNLANQFSEETKGIIVCGPIDQPALCEAISKLAEKLNFPILADPLSQLRSGLHSMENIVDAYDTFLRIEEAKAYLQPQLIIRFGAMPISKALTIYLKENKQAHQIVVDGGGGWRDPNALTTNMIYCDELHFCESILAFLRDKTELNYLHKWQNINEFTKQKLRSINDGTELSEGKLFYQLADLLPYESTVFVGNSMPIRDLDSFYHLNNKNVRIMANRGANGIDGVISTALGAASILQPVYLVLGDLTFFHDLNGLIAAKLHNIPIHIFLINNNGGGIFSFLPQANQPKHFELLFGTPLDIDFEHAVKMYGGNHVKIKDWNQLSQLVQESKNQPGLHVWELITARDTNVKEHRDLWKYVSQEMSLWLETER
jgi:2-succinyl-5-enolpyruvyl-6-hydroxy-3-cyclohexene-1-carboxylate synthase